MNNTSNKAKDALTLKPSHNSLKSKIFKYRHLYIMFLPVLVLLILFYYLPMIGIRIAFYDWGMFGPVEFVGLDNFKTILSSNMFLRAFRNTLTLSFTNLVLGMFFSVLFALLLNEVNNLFSA